MKAAIAKTINAIPGRIFTLWIGDFVPIFMLHRIKNPEFPTHGHDPIFLRQCLEYIRKNHFNPISLEALADLIIQHQPIPPKTVVFTIDDGFKDNIVDASDIFSDFDVPLTCFVISGFVDKQLWPWDDQISYVFEQTERIPSSMRLPNDDEFVMLDDNKSPISASKFRNHLKTIPQANLYEWLNRTLYPAFNVLPPDEAPVHYTPATISQLQTFIDQGHLVAPHTATHRILSQLDEQAIADEIGNSLQYLERSVSSVSKVFAYPTGGPADFDQRAMSVCQQFGFKAAVSTSPGAWMKSRHPLAMPRFSMPANFFDFLQYVGPIETLKGQYRSRR